MTTSVALCTYNGEKYIAEQLDSILKQSTPVNEIVVCDDGSTDETMQILQKYHTEFPNIFKIHQNKHTLKVIKNFEKAINLCTGDIIFLSDQDDVWFPDKVRKNLMFFENNPDKDALFHNLLYYKNGPHKNTTFNHYLYSPTENKDLLGHLLIKGNVITGAALAFRKLTNLEFDATHGFLHDAQLAIYFALKDKIEVLDECLGYYRIHPQQQIGSGEDVDIYQQKVQHLLKYSDFNTKANFIRKIRESWDKDFILFERKKILSKIDNEFISIRNQYLLKLPYFKRKLLVLYWMVTKKHNISIKDLL
ncbi:Chondroitin polymerase [Chryseobacterium taklimakanense]|uniref:Chondroitin polymerase n=1 Tax=Chryseobacterium taklimakanense TaxID=536441 RepID=A0A239XPD4_9FLAO|nr:glycosyltransferase [Chryseobacterium taklimakanense]SNV47943.1 Chondroitin polymerase [Chryseobacterium taklimakanense]